MDYIGSGKSKITKKVKPEFTSNLSSIREMFYLCFTPKIKTLAILLNNKGLTTQGVTLKGQKSNPWEGMQQLIQAQFIDKINTP